MSRPRIPSSLWIRQGWQRVAVTLPPPPFPVAAWAPCVAAGALAWGLHAAALPLLWNGVVALLLVGTLARFLLAVRWPRWLPTVVALAALAAIRPIYGYGFGQETGLALLFAAFSSKGGKPRLRATCAHGGSPRSFSWLRRFCAANHPFMRLRCSPAGSWSWSAGRKRRG